ncbi:MAG: O-antigen ligase family protein, partial [bacterium]|nr:O-antigen ligase family protein [bacterium]
DVYKRQLLQSGSRSGMLGVVLVGAMGGIAFGWRRVQRGISWRNVGVSVASVVVLAVCVIAPLFFSTAGEESSAAPLLRRLHGFYERLQSGSTSMIDRRELQWEQAIAMWRRYPITGVGVGAFAVELPNFRRTAYRDTPVDNAWNQYLQWLAELGLVGCGLWLWWIGAYIREVRKGDAGRGGREDRVALVTLGVFAVLLIFGAHLQAAEVACVVGVYGALVMVAGQSVPVSLRKLSAHDMLTLGCGVLLVWVSQWHYATRLLSYEAQESLRARPAGFGFYHVEDWQGQFSYQWAQRYAGREITVPEQARVMVLRLAAFDPDISEQRPKRVNVRVNGVLMDTLFLTDNNWNEYEVYVYQTPAGRAELSLECDRIWRPPHETPPRALGVALATEIWWRTELKRGAQGLSEWYEDTSCVPAVRYRWAGQRAAWMVAVPSNGVLSVRLRSPRRIPFYRDPVRVKMWFNNDFLGEITLPRDGKTWYEEAVIRSMALAEQRGVLSLEVNRTSRVRIPGSVRTRRVGVAVASGQE